MRRSTLLHSPKRRLCVFFCVSSFSCLRRYNCDGGACHLTEGAEFLDSCLGCGEEGKAATQVPVCDICSMAILASVGKVATPKCRTHGARVGCGECQRGSICSGSRWSTTSCHVLWTWHEVVVHGGFFSEAHFGVCRGCVLHWVYCSSI